MDKRHLSEKEKKLKHVKIYDQLYAQILDGRFPPGSRLPSEPELARQMDVSRMTLRQALALLQEDGLIKNAQGKGNFITEAECAQAAGLEAIAHPVHLCCTEALDETELEFRLEPPSDFIAKSLEYKTPAVVIVDRWYKAQEKALGYTLTFLPIEVMSRENVDLNYPARLKEFLEETIYQISAASRLKIAYSTTGNFTSQKYHLSDQDAFAMIQETLYDSTNRVLAMNKHYLPARICQLEVLARPRL